MPEKFNYPVARRDESVIDDYHGTPVTDPYRWMEDANAEETQAYIAAQNTLTQAYLEEISARPVIKARLTELWDFPKAFPPEKVAGKYVYQYNDGLQNQPVLYMRDTLESEPRVVLDPNTLSDDGTSALINTSFSKDGSLLAYSVSVHGSDRQEVFVLDVESGEHLDDHIKYCRWVNAIWKPDGSGFFYNRYPEPGTVPPEDEQAYMKVYFHEIGTSQDDDVLVYEDNDNKEWFCMPFTDDNSEFLFLWIAEGATNKNGFYYRPMDSDGEFIKIIPDPLVAEHTFIGCEGKTFYVKTDLDAPRGKIVAIDADNPAPENWQTIITEGDGVIDFASIVNGQLVVAIKENAYHRLYIHDLKGERIKEVDLPTIGAIWAITGKQQDSELFILYASYLYPTQVLRYDFNSGELIPFAKVSIKGFNTDDFETKQVFYTSKDGTKVSMFITHKKGLELNGDNPTVLYGYGGFSISLVPNFAISSINFIEQGGIWAVANLRGGGEYGEEWHKAGMLENKQNVFDDFIAAAEYLIAENYTQPKRLAIMGGSNGGLLVSACMLQRPDLYGAVICQVPVADMLRYHKFTAGRYWVPEYGNAEENPEHFEFLMKYSPLHNVKEGVTYPPMYLHTAESDDRVVPMHALKYTATIQRGDSGENPLLLHIETKAGHGFGKPTTKLIDQYTDIYAFLYRQLGIG